LREIKNGGSVQHLTVVYAAPGVGLRLRGALSWTLKPVQDGTAVALDYVVGGYIRGGIEQWAPRVGRVLDEQLQNLKSYIEGKPLPR
jgi:hypothetical protein